MAEKDDSAIEGAPAHERLEELIKTNRIVRFLEDLQDKEHPYVTCSVYGSPLTNEIFVRLANGRIAFVSAVPSRLVSPPMQDRIFGMDILDHEDAFRLAAAMWTQYQQALRRR